MSMPGPNNFPKSGGYVGAGFSSSAFFDSRVDSLKKQLKYSFGITPHMKRFKKLGGTGTEQYPISKIQNIPIIEPKQQQLIGIPAGVMGYATVLWKAWRIGWFEFKRIYTKYVKNDSNDTSYWIPKWIDEVGPLIPVRSGHMYSVMLGSIHIQRVSTYASRHWIFCTYNYPQDPRTGVQYPTQIRNPRHVPPAKGYGNDPMLVDTTLIAPNIHLMYTTPSGRGMYLLNDPSAMNDPRYQLNSTMAGDMFEDMKDRFEKMVIMVTI